MKEYEFIEHTADVGVKAYGSSLDEAFAHAAKAMFDVMTDSSEIDAIGEYEISLQADDVEQLLVDWLSELLFLHDVHNVVFGQFTVSIVGSKLNAKVYGDTFDVAKHNIGAEIKAVTYHMLEVHDSEPFFVQVLFDL